MVIDGRAIAESLYARMRDELSARACTPTLSIIVVEPNFETKQYLALKERKAAAIGVRTEVSLLRADSSTEAVIDAITSASNATGIVVQLPLPPHIDTDAVLEAIPPSQDVDALNPKTRTVLSPVVRAISEILKRHDITPSGRYVTIIGSGKLVGLPAYHWFTEMGAYVSVVTRETPDIRQYTQNADIIVCGAGVPGLLTPEMVKEGVVILDAGTSEEGGVLRGDADPACSERASLFTPVPGGIGPITVACLLLNLVTLATEASGRGIVGDNT